MASNPRQSLKDKGNDNPQKKTQRSKSKARFELSVASGSNEIIDEVVSEMNCPICKDHLQEPIFMCETGHNVCGVCKKNLLLPVCPLCKSTVTGQRNFALEAISSKICIPCVNTCYGCNYKCPSNTMSIHLEECIFKPIDCPFKFNMSKCNWSGNPKNLVHHFVNDHPNNITLKPGKDVTFNNFNLEIPDRDLHLIPIDHNLFLYSVEIDVAKKIGFWAIQMIGTKEDAQKWKYDFTFRNNEKHKYLNFSNKCESASTPYKQLFESGNCVGIPFVVMKNFLYGNKNFTFSFFIRPASSAPLNQRQEPNKMPKNHPKKDLMLKSSGGKQNPK